MNDGADPEKHHARLARPKAKGINGNGAGTPLAMAVKDWPTPGANEWKGSSKEGQRRGQLAEAILAWPTPTAGCKGPGGEGQREGGPTLQTVAFQHSLPGQATAPDGPPSSIDGPGSPPLWRTPGAHVVEAKGTVTKLAGRTPQDPQVGLADQAAAWDTPRSCSGLRSSGANRTQLTTKHGFQGRLNPDFVAWLMGLPPSWTAALTVLGRPEMQSYLSRQRQLLRSLLAGLG